MDFSEAFKALTEGKKIKRPEWAGWWQWEDGTIKMYCKDGSILDIRQTQQVFYTFQNIAAKDWEIMEGEPTGVVTSFSFSDAVRLLKQGKRVARSGWNGKGMWLTLIHAGNAEHLGYKMQDCIGMKTADNKMQPGWLASQPDMLATDWVILELQ